MSQPPINQVRLKSDFPQDDLIEISLDHYLNLVFKSKQLQLKNENFAIINSDQVNYIKKAPRWEMVVMIEKLEREDIDYLKNLRVIHAENQETWYKITALNVWIKMQEAQLIKQKANAEVRDILIRRQQRIREAIFTLTSTFKMDYTTAEFMMEKVILTGNMPDFAKKLDIEDLVINKNL